MTVDVEPVPRVARNVLVAAAQPLLQLAATLRHASSAYDLEPLRVRLSAMVEAFFESATRNGVRAETAALARYSLCTFLDESIAATAWGGGAWAAKSLLVIFHGEASGGERFFTILEKLSRDSRANIDILELLYLILSLGMAGRYRIIEGGNTELERVREKLRALILGERGACDRALSPARPIVRAAPQPWWRGRLVVAVAVTSIIAVSTLFWALHRALVEQSKRASATLAAVVLAHPVRDDNVAPLVKPDVFGARVAALLAPEIARGLVGVTAGRDRAVITLAGDGIFASGSAAVTPSRVPVIRRIGEALAEVQGRVIVVGHTDDALPKPGQPSNWQLSLARASHVADILRQETGEHDRFLVQGAGSLEPAAPNGTAANRARNRRVTITLLAPGASL